MQLETQGSRQSDCKRRRPSIATVTAHGDDADSRRWIGRTEATGRAVVFEGAARQRERPGIENAAASRAAAILARHEPGAADCAD